MGTVTCHDDNIKKSLPVFINTRCKLCQRIFVPFLYCLLVQVLPKIHGNVINKFKGVLAIQKLQIIESQRLLVYEAVGHFELNADLWGIRIPIGKVDKTGRALLLVALALLKSVSAFMITPMMAALYTLNVGGPFRMKSIINYFLASYK